MYHSQGACGVETSTYDQAGSRIECWAVHLLVTQYHPHTTLAILKPCQIGQTRSFLAPARMSRVQGATLRQTTRARHATATANANGEIIPSRFKYRDDH